MNKINYGETLRYYRNKDCKTLAELGALCNLSTSYLSDVERGRRGPLNAVLTHKIEEFLGIPNMELTKAGAREYDVPKEIRNLYYNKTGIQEVLSIIKDFDSLELTGLIVYLNKYLHNKKEEK